MPSEKQHQRWQSRPGGPCQVLVTLTCPKAGFSCSYVHRVGRTGRAGKFGTAVSLFCPEDTAFEAELARQLSEPPPTTSGIHHCSCKFPCNLAAARGFSNQPCLPQASQKGISDAVVAAAAGRYCGKANFSSLPIVQAKRQPQRRASWNFQGCPKLWWKA